MGWDAAPSPLWHGPDWVLLSQIPLKSNCYWGKDSPSLGQPCGKALLPAFQQFLSWLSCVSERWSLFIFLLGFPCVSLCLIPMFGCSCSSTFPLLFSICLSSPILAVSS